MLDIQAMFPSPEPGLMEALEASPRSLLAVNSRLEYNRPLKDGDPRYVDTAQARADRFRKHFFSTFGYDPASGDFEPQPAGSGKHVLFFGHVGCGKSTELARLCTDLHDSHRCWVVRVNLLDLINPDNADYTDLWLAVAQQLVQGLERDGLAIQPIVLQRLENWFSERVLTNEQTKELSAEVKTQAEGGAGLPWVLKLLAQFTAAVKTGSSRRDVVRTVVQNTFGEFVAALNLLVVDATRAVQAGGKGRQILFMIDGCDRFRSDDWKRLFVDDANQLTMTRCVAVYTVPMGLKSSGHRLDLFDALVLPMIKLHEFDDAAESRPVAYDAMRRMILKRCHHGLIDAPVTLDALIDYSGGHLRDALRLLSYACVDAEGQVLTAADVEAAAKRLAGDYRDWLEPEHYAVLAAIEKDPENVGRNDVITRLVDGGALLEYNRGTWRKPHPVVRLLTGFRKAQAALPATQP